MNKKQKIEQRLEADKDKDLEGCTFKPVMETHNESKRNFDQFLQDQSKFLTGRDEKIKTQTDMRT